MSKGRFTTLEWLLVLIPVGLLAVPFLSRGNWTSLAGFLQPVQQGRLNSCQSNLKDLGGSLRQYVQDADGHYPRATVGGPGVAGSPGKHVGWADALTAYESISVYHCPGESTAPNTNPGQRGYVKYWYNANLSGVAKSSLALPAATLLLGDGSDGRDITDATYSKTSLPPQWLTDPTSPAYRHLGGANYLMADGAVHWLKPEAVTTFGGRKNAFAIR